MSNLCFERLACARFSTTGQFRSVSSKGANSDEPNVASKDEIELRAITPLDCFGGVSF